MAIAHKKRGGNRFQDLTGQHFGRYVVLAYVETKTHSRWLCRCECGKEKILSSTGLRAHARRGGGCGCLHLERVTTHGMSYSSEYQSWKGMRRRCYDKKWNQYKDYGGRGIRVCARWMQSFENFYADMGLKPTAKHTLERVNNDLGYSPENCVWATRKEQSRNRRCAKR